MSKERKARKMGYSHTWSLRDPIPADTWELIRRDSEKLIRAFSETVEDSRVDETWIGFNGGCESFFLTAKEKIGVAARHITFFATN
jgi:hypothetical protein